MQTVTSQKVDRKAIERRQSQTRQNILMTARGLPDGKFTLENVIELYGYPRDQRHRVWVEIQRLIRMNKVRRLSETIDRGVAYQVVK